MRYSIAATAVMASSAMASYPAPVQEEAPAVTEAPVYDAPVSYTTVVETITSCAPEVEDCPKESTVEYINTVEVPLTTSTVYETVVHTVVDCEAAKGTACPDASTKITTETRSVGVTVCPIAEPTGHASPPKGDDGYSSPPPQGEDDYSPPKGGDDYSSPPATPEHPEGGDDYSSPPATPEYPEGGDDDSPPATPEYPEGGDEDYSPPTPDYPTEEYPVGEVPANGTYTPPHPVTDEVPAVCEPTQSVTVITKLVTTTTVMEVEVYETQTVDVPCPGGESPEPTDGDYSPPQPTYVPPPPPVGPPSVNTTIPEAPVPTAGAAGLAGSAIFATVAGLVAVFLA